MTNRVARRVRDHTEAGSRRRVPCAADVGSDLPARCFINFLPPLTAFRARHNSKREKNRRRSCRRRYESAMRVHVEIPIRRQRNRARRTCHVARGSESLQRLNDLIVLREAMRLVLGEDQTAFGNDVEHTAGSFDELRLHTQLALDCGGQPGRLWKVVSALAVADLNPHVSYRSYRAVTADSACEFAFEVPRQALIKQDPQGGECLLGLLQGPVVRSASVNARNGAPCKTRTCDLLVRSFGRAGPNKRPAMVLGRSSTGCTNMSSRPRSRQLPGKNPPSSQEMSWKK
jgi:hypothetical protein